jgi:hypothetical protein
MGLEVAKKDPQATSGSTGGGRKSTLNKITEEIWKAKQANEDNVSHAESDYSLQSDNNESEREEEDSGDLSDEEDRVTRRIEYGGDDEEEDGSFNQYYKSDGDRACNNSNEDAKNVSEDELESFDDEGSEKNLQSERLDNDSSIHTVVRSNVVQVQPVFFD